MSPALEGGFFTSKPSRKCKMQIKMTRKYHFTSTKIALVKSQTIICVNKVAQEVEQSSIPSENSFLITLKNSLLLLLLSRFSRVQLLVTPWTAAHQAPPSMGFSRQEYWSGVPLPSPAWCLLNC